MSDKKKTGSNALTRQLLRFLSAPFTAMPGNSFQGQPPALSAEQITLQNRLTRHVNVLAGDIGERHIGRYDALCRSVEYLCETFKSAGYTPQPLGFRLLGKDVYNVEAVLPGRNARVGNGAKKRILVAGAHYDS